MTDEQITQVARVCHEANRAWCQANGDYSQKPWALAPDWQKNSAVSGVKKLVEEDLSPAALHVEWCKFKKDSGWKFGPIKNEHNKTHPCLVPYDELPDEQKAKDALFSSIVRALKC